MRNIVYPSYPIVYSTQASKGDSGLSVVYPISNMNHYTTRIPVKCTVYTVHCVKQRVQYNGSTLQQYSTLYAAQCSRQHSSTVECIVVRKISQRYSKPCSRKKNSAVDSAVMKQYEKVSLFSGSLAQAESSAAIYLQQQLYTCRGSSILAAVYLQQQQYTCRGSSILAAAAAEIYLFNCNQTGEQKKKLIIAMAQNKNLSLFIVLN